MEQIKWVLILMLATSCQFFEMEKISSDAFYEEEMQAIDWESVTQYPAFEECEAFTEKNEQKHCFETRLRNHVYRWLEGKPMVTYQDLNHTVLMDLTISKTGAISDLQIEMDSVLRHSLPLLQEWLTTSIDSLPPLEPAYKSGIPVKTKFTLPVVIATN
ncbi:MAG: hypothetical protein AAFP76_02590 [Bacteroidota bacterium]